MKGMAITFLGILFLGHITPLFANTPKPFYLKDIPPIKDKTPISMVLEKGFSQIVLTNLLPQFIEQTGIPVKVIEMELGEMYEVQQAALLQGEGKYDLLSIESGWAKDWAANGFTIPLLDMAEEFDSQGKSGMVRYLDNYYEALLHILSYHGQFHSIPYQTYNMGLHYRSDLFDHPDEKKAFQSKFGYPLQVPQTFANLIDIAQFFTRKTGDTLAGKPLKNDFYGVALMAGLKPHINDEFSSILWGLGGTWFKPLYTPSGQVQGFQIEANNAIAAQAAQIYLQLLQYTPPEALTKNWAFLESANALANGRVAMWPFAYNNLWSWSAKGEQQIPDAKIDITLVPNNRPYTGAYAFGVAYDSKNPEAAYWLLKYIGSYEGQMAYAKNGGNPCRKDVALDPIFQTEIFRLTNGQQQKNHEALLQWGDQVRYYGHFTSVAMGKIYPELMKASHRIATKQVPPQKGLNDLAKIIKTLQNQFGEKPTLE